MENDIATFCEEVWEYYRVAGRHDLPWRLPEADGNFDPYKILVSELMLQQTQVQRVIPKFSAFLAQFPTAQALAQGTLGEVLEVWSGLGYNRRAKFLWQAAQKIALDFSGSFPESQEELETLPGVGKNTAGAIVAYAFNQPAVFIETNVRTVFIHHFFNDAEAVSDKAIYELTAASVDSEHPREWYWALMDYGTHLKQTVGNLSRVSKSYSKQPKFTGSRRQIRGQVIRALVERPHEQAELRKLCIDDRLDEVLSTLVQEGLITQAHNTYRLS
jgi:A/G-specific adenine glycosylase